MAVVDKKWPLEIQVVCPKIQQTKIAFTKQKQSHNEGKLKVILLLQVSTLESGINVAP